ncbi:MAG: hypothetical protein PHE36_09705 [Novosphingobium sp.]|nr:hypothetical protein [Novosphingobium sp.]
MAKSDQNRSLAGLEKGKAAKIISAVTMLSASLGMNPAAAAEAPEQPTVEGSTQAKIDSIQAKNVGSRQIKVDSEQIKLDSDQVKVDSEQIKLDKPK